MAIRNNGRDSGRYLFEIYNHADLRADWNGWRLRGRWLISPDGDRINPARLRGILFVESNRKRVCRETPSSVTVYDVANATAQKRARQR